MGGRKTEALVCDPIRLKHILINLNSNAIKFTEKGEVRIKAICSKSLNQSYQIEIQITDSGIGMKKNDINLIFDEYVQIESKTGKKYSGTGLGLSIVKKLVEYDKSYEKRKRIISFIRFITATTGFGNRRCYYIKRLS